MFSKKKIYIAVFNIEAYFFTKIFGFFSITKLLSMILTTLFFSALCMVLIVSHRLYCV